MEGIISFHHDVMFITYYYGFCVLNVSNLYLFAASKTQTHKLLLTILYWNCMNCNSSFILVIIAVPSFALLYAMDEVVDPAMTIKVNGHQWYWSYEYSDFLRGEDDDADSIAFDSYLIPEDELNEEEGELRLLEVDNRVLVPTDTMLDISYF